MLQRGEAGQSHFQEKEKISVIYFLLSSLAFLFFHKWKRSPAQSCWAGSKGSIALGANRPCLLLAHLIPTSPKETGMSWQTLRRQRVLSIPCPVPWAPPLPSPGAAAFSPQDFRQTHHKPQQYFTSCPYLFLSEFSETQVWLGRFNSCIWTRCPHRVTRCPPMQIQLNKVKSKPKKEFIHMNVFSNVQSHMLI